MFIKNIRGVHASPHVADNFLHDDVQIIGVRLPCQTSERWRSDQTLI